MVNRIYFEKYLSEDDFSYYWNLASNEKVMVMNYGRIFTTEEAKQSFNFMLRINQKHEQFGYYKVFETSTKSYIGLGGIIINDDLTEAEIEYLLFPGYWGNRYGSELVKELLHRIEKIKSIHLITAITDPENVASRKILLRNGFISHKILKIDDGSLAETFIRTV